MEYAGGLLLGIVGGGVGGWLLSRVRLCGAEACRSRANTAFSVIAGAVFGAAVAWHVMTR